MSCESKSAGSSSTPLPISPLTAFSFRLRSISRRTRDVTSRPVPQNGVMHPKGIDFFLVGEPLAGGEDRRRGRQERVTAGRLTSSPLKGGCCYGKRHKVQAPKTNTVMRLVGRESGKCLARQQQSLGSLGNDHIWNVEACQSQ